MGYNSISGLYEHCGLDYADFPTGVMISFQNKADYSIWNLNTNPATGLAEVFEADLVFQYVTRYQLLTNLNSRLNIPNKLLESPDLNMWQKRQLIGCPFNGSEVID